MNISYPFIVVLYYLGADILYCHCNATILTVYEGWQEVSLYFLIILHTVSCLQPHSSSFLLCVGW